MMRPRRLLLALLVLPHVGCGVELGYALYAVGGQLAFLAQTVPIDRAIAEGGLSDEQVRRLKLVQDARQFARDQLGLFIDNSFERLYEAGGGPAVINVSAARQDALEPRTWTFPFAGAVESLGFFDQSTADVWIERLKAEGLDVFVYEPWAYTVGYPLHNPVLSPLLEQPDDVIVDVVLHELLHATIFRPDDAAFNESLATFVGQEGSLRYWRARHPGEPQRAQLATNRFADRDRYRAFVLETYEQLAAFYASDLSAEDKLTGRRSLFESAKARFTNEIQPLMHYPESYEFVDDLEMNNAFLLLVRRYNLDLDVFQAVLDAAGGNWSAALDLFRQAAATRGDPFQFLRAATP